MNDAVIWLDSVVARSVVLILLVLIGAAVAYRVQRHHTMRELEAIAMQERHLYRLMQEQAGDIERLRMIHHNAKNELILLKGMLECGKKEEALAYVQELLQQENG